MVHSLATGVGAYLVDLVRERLGLQACFLRPGLIGRAMSTCLAETDRREALDVGKQAVACLAAGQSSFVITLERVSDKPYVCETGLASLAEVVNVEKLLPREFINQVGNMVIEAFWAYALLLIGGLLPSLA